MGLDKLKIVEDMSFLGHIDRGWVLVKLPIAYIELPDPWNALRFKNSMELIGTTWALPPVVASFNEMSGLFVLTDGIHRTNVVKELGYDYVPAMIPSRDYNRFDLEQYRPYVKAKHIGFGIYA